MATDWMFYYMTGPLGLAIICSTVLLPFLLWRLILGRSFRDVGMKPLAFAYVAALLGLLILQFVSSYLEFSNRVSSGLLSEAQRWSTVPGWTIYIAVLLLALVLPVLGVLGVPITATLLRLRKLRLLSAALGLLVVWLALSLAFWAFPSNTWHATHRADSFLALSAALLPGILFIGVPFVAAVLLTTRTPRNAEA